MAPTRVIATMLLGLLLTQGCGRSREAPGSSHDWSATSFQSGDRRIGVERFEPEGRTKSATVILLHGAYGPERDGEFLRPLGKQLASRGYLVLMPHYFDRTSTKAEDLVGKDGVLPEGARLMEQNYSAWEATVGNAIKYAAKQPGNASDRIGLLGFSLGASLSCSWATHDARVKAVVDFGGGLPFAESGKIGSTPPTLIFHGDSDKLVPIESSAQFERLLKSGNVSCEMVTYHGEDHYFGTDALRDAGHRGVDFLAKHLDTK